MTDEEILQVVGETGSYTRSEVLNFARRIAEIQKEKDIEVVREVLRTEGSPLTYTSASLIQEAIRAQGEK